MDFPNDLNYPLACSKTNQFEQIPNDYVAESMILRKQRGHIGLAVLLFSWIAFEVSVWANEVCQGNSNLVGPCFSMRGR